MKHSHKSTKWDRPKKVFRLALYRQLRGQQVITLTEVVGRLAFVLLGWGTVKTSELAILWKHSRYRRAGKKRVIVLSQRGLPTRGGQKVHALLLPLKDRATKKLHVIIAIHIPSDAEGVHGLKDNTNGQISDECIRELASLYRVWTALGYAVHITGDWNLNWRVQWVRELIYAEFGPDVRCTWDNKRPDRGTHHDRLIDWTLSSEKITDVELGQRTGDTDHVEFEETLAA